MLNYKRHLLTWSNLTDEVIRTSWCWGNLLSGWGRDSRGLDRDPACRRCHPRTGALSETSAWPLLRPLAETQYWRTDRERERITDNPHICALKQRQLLYLSFMLETELRKLSIFLDTSSIPFLKKFICGKPIRIEDYSATLTIMHTNNT